LRVARRRRAEKFYACGALEQFRAARSTRTLDGYCRDGSMASRKLKLTPEQNAILRLLEEAGSETIGTILNTLHVAPTREGRIPAVFQESLEALQRLDLVAWEGLEDRTLDSVEFVVGNGWKATPDLDQSAQLILTERGSGCLAR